MSDCDVLVVGAGNAALAAAVAAREQGAPRVVVLEKAPRELRGGNTHYSGGLLRFAFDTADDLRPLVPDAERRLPGFMTGVEPYPATLFLADLQRVTEGRTDPELAEILKHFASPFQHRPACNGPVAWKDWPAAQADIDLAKAATQGAQAEDVFMTSPSPGQIARYLKNRHYKTDEDYIYALADVMRREYQAIVAAGFILQLDCPDLAMLRHMVYPDLPLADYRRIISVNVAALNHAVRDLPPERMRMHVCWGSTMAPHHTDVEIRDIIDIVLSGRPHAVSFPAANPRHEHEWKVWRDVKLPPGKKIIPGVIDSTTNVVEHPELVADRILNFASVVGRENVMAGVDCGFGTFAGRVQVDTKIVWLKLQSLVEGAQRASRQLWAKAA